MLKRLAHQGVRSALSQGKSCPNPAIPALEILCCLETRCSQWQSLQPLVSSFSTHYKQNIMNAAPASLSVDRVMAEPRPGVERSFFAKAILKIAGYYSKESQQLMAAKAWYSAVTQQIEDSRIYKAFDLDEEKYRDKYAMLCIHMWMTLVRLRKESSPGKSLTQLVYDNFQEDVEHRVRAAGVKVRISKHLADQEQIFFGTSLAYDKALDGGESLSSALLRNVYQKQPDKKGQAETLARYVTRELACLAMTDSDSIMKGQVKFSTAFLADS